MQGLFLFLLLVVSAPCAAADTPPASGPQQDTDPALAARIAKDAQRDLQADGYYNKPGATRAEYNRDWQQCRMIARGSPGGGIMGGIVDALVDNAVEEGRERRANRKSCMLFKGWRFVTPTDADRANLIAMSDSERTSQLDRLIGAKDLKYKDLSALGETQAYPYNLDFVNRVETPGRPPIPKMDPSQNVKPDTDHGVVLIGIRRPDNFSLGRSAMVEFDRYDLQTGDLVPAPKPAPAQDVTYSFVVTSHNKDNPLEYYTFRVTAGDYVLTSVGIGSATTSPAGFCFAAPLLHVPAGKTVYVGDFTPVWDARTSKGGRVYALGYSNHLDDANVFAKPLTGVTDGVVQADIRNGATFPCHAQAMSGYIIPDRPYLPASDH